jgi:hypothetical protein
MATKTTKKQSSRGQVYGNGTPIRTLDDAVALMEEFEAIRVEIEPKMDRQVEIKKAVTEYAVEKKLDVIQVDDAYFRKVQRENTFWVATDDELPTPKPRGAMSLKSIVENIDVVINGRTRSLWNFITKRVPDPERIDEAVRRGYITEKEISKAYLAKQQAPFLQRFNGTAQ